MDAIYQEIDSASGRHIMEFIRSSLSSEILRGIPVRRTAELLLLKRMDNDFRFDGFTLIRIADITRYRTNNQSSDFLKKVQKANQLEVIETVFPSLESWQSFFEEVSDFSKPVSLYRASSRENTFHVGQIMKVSSCILEVKYLDPTAIWAGSRKYRYLSPGFCRVDYGDRYAEVLHQMARDQ